MAKRLAIDLERVKMAFEDHAGQGQWFLDTETGEAVHLSEDDEPADELSEQMEKGGERYVEIPCQSSQVGHRDMAEFIASVTDLRLRALLDRAIQGKGAFRRFKDVLQDHRDERERWFAFQKERAHGRIRRWLATLDIEPVAPPPPAG